MKIIVTGATGLIGRELIYKLMTSGHEVVALARSKNRLPELPAQNILIWSDDQQADPTWFAGVDAVVHLAGEGIADKPWTEKRKQRIRDSRITGTRHVVQAMAQLPAAERPHVFISGSAIGFYGSGDEPKSETSSAGNDFLADLCVDWEKESTEAEKLGIRTVLLRTGLVLSRKGGLLTKSGPAVLGDGKQWMSWIHIEDMVSFIVHAIGNQKASGAYNLTAPHPVTNEEFTKTLAQVMSIPLTFKVPKIILKTVLGEMSEAVLSNQKVLPVRTVESGFSFKFEDLASALKNLWGDDSMLDNHVSFKQFVPKEKHEIFTFFGEAENLEILTPPWLNFHITKKSTEQVTQGSLIDYKLKIHKIPVKWRTLISEWNPEHSFVDDQLKGPYKKWHHVHTFETVPGGTLISDDVTFRVPGGWLGKVILPLIKKDVQQIFDYRQEKIKSLYSESKKS